MLKAHAELGRRITPVLLTFNEAPNLPQTLASLEWAERIVIVDSGSKDDGKAIAESFPNVIWKCRPFDTHAEQWRFAIDSFEATGEYVLALDADMVVRREFLDETLQCFLRGDFAAAIVPFRYVLGDVVLPGSLYPAQMRLFRRDAVSIHQVGHTQVFRSTKPSVYRFSEFLLHDDRKPFEHWLKSQLKYAGLESARMNAATAGSLKDWFRRCGLMPLLAGFTAFVKAGGVLSGKAAMRYAHERMLYECMLGIHLMKSPASVAESTPGAAHFELSAQLSQTNHLHGD